MKFSIKLSELPRNTQLEILRTTSNKEMLEYFSKSSEFWDRFSVAGNPATPINVLDEFLFDSEYLVQLEVIRNPNLSGTSIDRLSDITSELKLELGIISHQNTEKETLQKLMKGSRHKEVRIKAYQRLIGVEVV